MPNALSPDTSALVLIDLQRGVTALDLRPRSASEIVASASALARSFRALGAPVVLVRVTYRADGADRVAPLPGQPAPGAPARDFSLPDPGLHTEPSDLLVSKHQWGAFYGTDLDLLLRRNRVDTVVVAGIATHMGVESTVREAWERSYRVLVAEDATGAPSEEDHRHSTERVFPRIATVTSCAEVTGALTGVGERLRTGRPVRRPPRPSAPARAGGDGSAGPADPAGAVHTSGSSDVSASAGRRR